LNRSISDFRGVFYFFHRDILSRKVVSDKPGTVQMLAHQQLRFLVTNQFSNKKSAFCAFFVY
ncbi:hypothetical protein, partial [Acinetobacter haemolyticus]|uniref:hypothetical protein n=1 Tax=Acinetobacter haemolyticus TaxID=29430 RepID=UPI001BB16BE1